MKWGNSWQLQMCFCLPVSHLAATVFSTSHLSAYLDDTGNCKEDVGVFVPCRYLASVRSVEHLC